MKDVLYLDFVNILCCSSQHPKARFRFQKHALSLAHLNVQLHRGQKR